VRRIAAGVIAENDDKGPLEHHFKAGLYDFRVAPGVTRLATRIRGPIAGTKVDPKSSSHRNESPVQERRRLPPAGHIDRHRNHPRSSNPRARAPGAQDGLTMAQLPTDHPFDATWRTKSTRGRPPSCPVQPWCPCSP